MVFNRFRRFILLAASLALMLGSIPTSALAYATDAYSPPGTDLTQFVETVKNGQAGVAGVFVQGVMAQPVLPQPLDNSSYVSADENAVTQFGLASKYNNVGLLAHNTLAGENFFDLTLDQHIQLVYGTGRVETFIVTQILEYQALDPDNPYSDFKDLDTGVTLSAEQMFYKIYTGGHHLALQTCINRDGNDSWGRLFIIAKPIIPQAD